VSKAALSKAMKASKCRIQLLVGAGDIGAEVNRITKLLKNEN
jgi:UDP-N-acetylmuramate--alanine ligase